MLNQSTSYPHWTQVYGEAKAEEPWPRVYRAPAGGAFVCFFCGVSYHFTKGGSLSGRSSISSRECEQDRLVLLTGPEAAEYVAAAREGRDAVWPPKERWPKVLSCDTCWRVFFSEADTFLVWKNGGHIDSDTMTFSQCIPDTRWYREITGTPEAEKAITLAREWREKQQLKPQPAPLPTAEEVAEKVVTQQCGIGRPAAYDPDQQVRLSYAVNLIANAIHHDRRLRESTQRVKHDWTGAMGTVLMEHGGTSFVKWDDGQVTSVYNRHLQKELE